MATVKDVAERAGVSISTVSRALSGSSTVNGKTRARVMATARELGYQPNSVARGLRSGITENIGLVTPDIENPFFAAITKGVQARARRVGYDVFMADSDEDPEQELELIASLAKQVDGLILSGARAESHRILEVIGKKPTVIVNRKVEGLPSVLIDNGSGMVQIIDHLQALGHRHVAYAAGPQSSWSANSRLSTMRREAEARPDLALVELGHFSPFVSGGHLAADLAIAKGVTALVCYNDLVAVGALERLRKRGIRVPDQISVVGFDDGLLAELTYPALTTVTIPLNRLGKLTVDLITRRIADPAKDLDDVCVSVGLNIRSSTGEV